jgi:NADPH:quinone reductase-like Zn-dependent oxidoreductase
MIDSQNTMLAVGLEQFGGPEVVRTLTIPRPVAPDDGLLIRVVAAGVNPADWRIRNGQFKAFIRPRPHFILGADIAGIVEAVGAQSPGFQPGDRVYAMLPVSKGGGFAQYAVVPAKTAAHLPDSLSFVEAAAAPLTALTALQALRKVAPRAGERLLIHGAAGGVGSYAVQIARIMGARVTGVASGRNADFVCALGAETSVDYTTPGALDALRGQFALVFDAANYLPFSQAKALLTPGGRYVSVNPTAGLPPRAWWARLTTGMTVKSIFVRPVGADLATLAEWFATGALRSAVEQVYPLNDVAAALAHSETGHVRGKLVVQIDAAATYQTNKG